VRQLKTIHFPSQKIKKWIVKRYTVKVESLLVLNKTKTKFIKIKKIQFIEEIKNVFDDKIAVLVKSENGYMYIINVATPHYLLEKMHQEKLN